MTVELHSYGGWNPTPLSKLDPETALSDAAELLDCRWWISAGTALGMHRDGGFIPWDTDVDIGIEADWDNPPSDLLPWHLFQVQKWRGRPMQLAYLHPNGVPVDLYLFYRDRDVLFNRTTPGLMEKPARFLKRRRRIQGWWAPSPIVDYLVWRYGPNWHVPTGVKRPWTADAACLIR